MARLSPYRAGRKVHTTVVTGPTRTLWDYPPSIRRGQRWRSAQQPGVERNLRPVILFVRDTVVHPGQPGALLTIESAHVLQHPNFACLSDLCRTDSVTPPQQPEQLALGSRSAHTTRVLSDERGKALPGKVRGRARELVRPHEPGLDNVGHQFGHRPHIRRGTKVEPAWWDVPDLGDDPLTRVPPGFDRLPEQRVCRHRVS